MVGDCTLGTDENFDYDTSLNAYYESYGPDYFFSNVKSIFSADDLTIANFEGTLTYSEEREEKQFAFKAPPEFASILSAGDIEAVNTANNPTTAMITANRALQIPWRRWTTRDRPFWL